MKAEELHLAQLYVDGELGEDQVTDLLHRIEADPDLKKHVEQLEMVENLAGSLEVYRAPSVDFTVHSAVSGAAAPADLSRSSMASLPVARPSVPRISMSSFLAGAAAAAACILLGFGLAGQIHGPQVPVPVETSSVFRMVYFSSTARSVSVLGDFNGWSSEIPLRAGNGGYWETEVQVAPGEYRYVFVVDGRQHVPDPTADYVIDDDFGSKNSVVRIGL